MVAYEDVVAHPRRTVRRVLDHVGVAVPPDWRPESPHRRQADAVNATWVRLYRAAVGTVTDAAI